MAEKQLVLSFFADEPAARCCGAGPEGLGRFLR